MKYIALPAATLCLSISLPLQAETERDLDSHVHGGASLNMAIDDDRLHMEFESPWVNLVGFEHAPSTDEQASAVEEAIQKLQQADSLFVFAGTSCELHEAVVDSSMGNEHEEHHDDEHEAGHDESAESHDEDHHEEHDEEHEGEHEGEHDADHAAEHQDHEGAEHAEVRVAYVFDCADISKLESVDVALQSVWPGIDDIDVQLVGPQGQSLVELGPDRSTVDMSDVL